MDVILATCGDEKEKINKTYSTGVTFDCQFKDSSSVMDPVVIVHSSSNFSGYNVMSIPAFNNRKYYITDIKVLRADMWEISGHVDVLYTYASAILANSAVISRQTNEYNLYLDDPEFKVYNNKQVDCYKFTTPFSKNLNFLLTVAGD